MNKKPWISGLLALILMMSLSVSGALAEEPDAFLAQLEGGYEELFSVMCAPEYDAMWEEACAPIEDDAQRKAVIDALKSACVGTLYGDEAVQAFSSNPETAQFNCYFLEGVALLTFEGNTISGTNDAGETVFSHEYRFVGEDEIPGFTGFRVYESLDADSGEFTYFTFAPDTPEETFHIEFRYGSDREALAQLMEGPYAYWLAAGMPAPYTDEDVYEVIELFCVENLGEAEDEAA